MTTTSLRQGQTREGMSEGSQRQTCEPTNRNIIEGRESCGELAQHNEASGSGNTVNDAVVQGQFTVLSGEICPSQRLQPLWESDCGPSRKGWVTHRTLRMVCGSASIGNGEGKGAEVSSGHSSSFGSEGPNNVDKEER
ncbi:MAG: hypothetical protein AAFX78_20325 [Cyanobacteria bacterium J06638_20]